MLDQTLEISTDTLLNNKQERLGLELGLKDYHIANITKDFPNRSVTCCGKMLQKWLDIDPSASWNKLYDAIKRIKSPTTNPMSNVNDPTGNCIDKYKYM